ncbi:MULTISPECIES: type IIL restriction-modification enzyme MmeI [Gardnerella]|nr:type IIL restriction-modification enzyme MmeI [Gardnerella sp. DNF01162]
MKSRKRRSFGLNLMQNVLGIPDAINNTEFEYRTANRGYIDMLCPDSRFLVEQKSKNVDLDKPEERQGDSVTPAEQAVRYSDNLPLPELTSDMREKVIEAGKAILKARANHPGQSLADLYDPKCMPQDLRKAHDELDKVVDVAFGSAKPCSNNDERLEILFKSYIRMTKE